MTRFRPFFSLRVRLILLVLLALIPALAIMLYTAAETRQREAERIELQVKLDLMPDRQILPEGMRLSLFRIYQELLNNAAQHAQASQVWIRFTLELEQVVLEVQDDGRGFEAPQRWIELARQGQLGLVETLERAEAIG